MIGIFRHQLFNLLIIAFRQFQQRLFGLLTVSYTHLDVYKRQPALIAVALVALANLAAVRLYGEIEFWFAMIKVTTIIVMIVIGPVSYTHLPGAILAPAI